VLEPTVFLEISTMEHARGAGKQQRNANKEWSLFSGTGHRLGGDSGETLQSPDERRKKDRRMNATNEITQWAETLLARPEPASSGETLRSPDAWCNKCQCMHTLITIVDSKPPVRFRNAVTGKELHLDRHVHFRSALYTDEMLPCWLDPNTRSLEWYLKYIAYLLNCHISAIRFVATKVDGDSCVITYKDRSFTLLTSLHKESDENIWVNVMVDGTQSTESWHTDGRWHTNKSK
jgi:hypothetical protein